MAAKPIVTIWGPTCGTYAADDDSELRRFREQMMIVARRRSRIEQIAEQWGVPTLDVTPVVPCRGGSKPIEGVRIVLYVEPFENFRYFTVGAKAKTEGPRGLEGAIEEVVGLPAEVRGRGSFFQADLADNHLEPIV